MRLPRSIFSAISGPNHKNLTFMGVCGTLNPKQEGGVGLLLINCNRHDTECSCTWLHISAARHTNPLFRCASISCTDHRNSLPHGPKLEIGLFSCLTALSPSVLYSIHGNDTSGQSSHPDRTGPDQTRPGSKPDQSLKLQKVFVSNYKIYLSQTAKCICLKLQNVFVLY